MTPPWTTLGVISIVLLIFYWRGVSAVWGGLLTGTILGLIVSFILGFQWVIVGKWAIGGTLAGFGAILLGKVADVIEKS